MKKKFDIRILIIIILAIIFIGMIFMYNDQQENSNEQVSNVTSMEKKIDSNQTSTSRSSNNQNVSKINASGEIKSGLTEKIELHATYYYSEIYVEKNKIIQKGSNILKYSNGEYLVAPYDCIITDISIPEVGGKCTNEHYIEIVATNVLEVSFNINETNIEKIQIGQNVAIKVEALGITLEGYISHISSTGENGYFTVTVEFENNGNIKLGMTAKIEIDI